MNQDGFTLPDFKAYYEATVIKAVWYCNKDRYTDKWRRTCSLEKDHQIYD